MIDILQLVPLRPEVQKDLEAKYRIHGKADFDKVAGIVRGCVTNGHSAAAGDDRPHAAGDHCLGQCRL